MTVGSCPIMKFGSSIETETTIAAAVPVFSMLKVLAISLPPKISPMKMGALGCDVTGEPELLSPSFTTTTGIFGSNVNPILEFVPPAVVTVTFPDDPVPTTAVMVFAFTEENDAAGVPPKLTAVTPDKLKPVMVIVSPVRAVVGVKDNTFGDGLNVKPVRVAVPPGVVTDILPDDPVPTTAVICVDETKLNEAAGVPPKETAETPVRFVPLMVTVDPLTAVAGVNEVIVGVGMKINPASVAVPPTVVTDTLPDVPFATTAVTVVDDTGVNADAVVPPKLTSLAPVRLVPVMVIVAPLAAVVGVNEVMMGPGINVKPASVAVPVGVVTETLPEELVDATMAVMVVAERNVNELAGVPLKLTAVTPVKLVPVIVMVAPDTAVVGANDVMVGEALNVKPARVAVPPGVVSETEPDDPAATTAVTWVADTGVKDVAGVPPKLTAVTPVKNVPLIVTVAPLAAVVGVNDPIVGGLI